MPAGIRISSDDLAVLANTDRWHSAMRRMGRAAVEVELRRRPGRPTERIDDIGGEPPYPTREFCERWCTEQDNKLFQFSLRTAAILTLFVAVIVCVLQAVTDFDSVPSASVPGFGARPAATADTSQGRRSAPEGIFDIPAYRPVIPPPSQQQMMRQQQMQPPAVTQPPQNAPTAPIASTP
jgi:hypothetical protein